MKCKECPVFGDARYDRSGKGKSLCFCLGKPTTETKPDDDCQYGIEDYEDYIRELSELVRRVQERKGETK